MYYVRTRVCLGRRFAQIELLLSLSMLIQNFVITSADPSKMNMESLLAPRNVRGLSPANPVKLRFALRDAPLHSSSTL